MSMVKDLAVNSEQNRQSLSQEQLEQLPTHILVGCFRGAAARVCSTNAWWHLYRGRFDRST